MSRTKEVKKVSFEGQVFSVGLDVHKNSWSVSVIKGGMLLKKFTIEPSTSLLLSVLNKKYPDGQFEFCYEAGFCGFWIQRNLSKLGYKCIVINPADVPTTQKDKVTKSDDVDSRKLAESLYNNVLTPIHIPTIEEEGFRDVYRYRLSLVKKQTALKNQIKSFLNKCGIEIPEDYASLNWSRKFIQWLKTVKFQHRYSKLAFSNYLEDLNHISAKVSSITKDLQELLKKDKEKSELFRILKTTPGIGNVCAISLIAELWDIKRFETDDKLCSYVGLIPMTKNSGDKTYVRGVTFRHKKKLRCMLVESSWVAIREDPAMLIRYEELKTRMQGNKAILRIAKKLLRRIRYIWMNRENYVTAVA